MVNGGHDDNGAQFFFTLGRADELNKKNTLFGKVYIRLVYHASIIMPTIHPFTLLCIHY